MRVTAPRPLVDSHCHLDAARFDADRAEVLARARAAGVGAIVNIGCDLAGSARSLALAATHDDIWATVGVHPHEAKDAPAGFDDELVRLAAHPRCVAIGECGLDYHYDHSPRDVQQAVFATQLDVARRVGKPVVLHIRPSDGHDAFDDAVAVLTSHGGRDVGGVFHCFTGTVAQARRALDLGFLVSLPGVITFRDAGELPEVARFLPASAVLVETDAPYLAPVPHRGKRNEPAYVALTADAVAAARGDRAEAVREATGANARRLFCLR